MPSLLPFVAAAVVLILIYAGITLFPVFEGWMSNQTCIASGHTNCAAQP